LQHIFPNGGPPNFKTSQIMAEERHVPAPGDLPEEFLDEEAQFDFPLDFDFDDNESNNTASDTANMPEDWEIDDETLIQCLDAIEEAEKARMCLTTTPNTNSISAASGSAPRQRRHALVTEEELVQLELEKDEKKH
jgi:hypothetical protein